MTLEPVLAGRYEDWQGLPPLTLDDVETQLAPVLAVAPPVERNRTLYRYNVVGFERAAPPAKIDAWVRAGARHVFILELRDPAAPDLEHTVDVLGQPDVILEDRLLHPLYLVEDFLYSGRGITLSIGRTLDGTARRALLHVRLFPSMTREQYLTEVDDTTGITPKTYP